MSPDAIAAFEAIALALYGSADEAYEPCNSVDCHAECVLCGGAKRILRTPDELVAKAKADGERIEKLADIMWFHAHDETMPAHWSIQFEDRTGRTEEGGIFDGNLLRSAVDAMGKKKNKL